VSITPGLGASSSERLREKIELLLPVQLAAGRRLLDHPCVRDAYPEYLVTMHGIIRASVPLMQTASARATRLPNDPVAARLVEYLEEHIPEEADHDEWLLEDLEALGMRRASVLERPPTSTVAALVGAQYYWILHYHPVALLGYIAVLEGYPPDPADVEALEARTGYPARAYHTVAAHAELDQHHRDELLEAIDALPLTGAHERALGMSAVYTVHMTARALDEVCDRVGAIPP
jgi:pyrroloquinoline quinone (PQQ) biosynthesis protein C